MPWQSKETLKAVSVKTAKRFVKVKVMLYERNSERVYGTGRKRSFNASARLPAGEPVSA